MKENRGRQGKVKNVSQAAAHRRERQRKEEWYCREELHCREGDETLRQTKVFFFSSIF